ncbi:MAG: hypothetical protein ACK4YM_07945 [Novosphingobium sp.]
MIRRHAKSLIALTALATSTVAWACADLDCEGRFNLLGQSQSCQGRAMLAPSNDSRINLMLLLADRGGRTMEGLKPSKAEDSYSWVNHPSLFLDWAMLRRAMFPAAADPRDPGERSYAGSRCQSYAGGSAALVAAMKANTALPESERSALITARAEAEAVCKSATAYSRRYADKGKLEPLSRFTALPQVTSKPGREFLGYITAADAFYAEAWDDARSGFAGLAGASDPFVRETAAYMLIRVEFAAAQAGAFGEYGDYDPAKLDRAAVKRGLEALSAYLKSYPQGRYAASATALLRRGLWLAGNYEGLSSSYAGMLERTSPNDESAALLVEEVDTKLLFNPDARKTRLTGPLLLATRLLIDMRDDSYGEGPPKPGISAQALDAMAPQFAAVPDLFSYLQATHAFYYAKDYRRVLQLVPDDARRASHTNLSFSRQLLRGMALAALKDPNQGGFWQELLGGAKGPWQRPLAELGLAMHWERAGRIDAVFAGGSPISDPAIRSQLITYSSSPALLRKIVRDPANRATERDLALYTLLANQLVLGRYGDFAGDVKLPAPIAGGAATIFTRGRVSAEYPCAPIAVTAAALAKNPEDIPGRLCLGDFFRLNGLDGLRGPYDPRPGSDELGGVVEGFSGKRNFRSEFYSAIIADPRAGANDKAYALYRAVMCYAPSGLNDCGGAEVPKAQRKAWFERLKRDYPQSRWAKMLRYYW